MMPMKKLYDLARGTVRILISGAVPETVLNRCSENGIEFRELKSVSDYAVEITVYSFDLTNVRSIAAKCGCDMGIISTAGGKKLAKGAKRRYALLAGFVLCVIIAAVFSVFVWDIGVEGNSTVSYGDAVRMLEECGVGYGTFWPAVSADEVCNDILLGHPEISWVTVNMKNSRLEMVIHERVEKPEIVNESEARDVVASKDGLIIGISALDGKSTVSVGDTVRKGECLISGTVDSETAEERYVHALGDVQARTWYEISAVTPLKISAKEDKDGHFLKTSLLIGKNRINFYSDSRNKAPSCDKINKIGYVSIKNAFLIPVGLNIQKGSCFAPTVKSVDAEAETQRLQTDLMEELKFRIGDGEIVTSNFTVSETDELLIVTLRAECIENIAAEDK